MGLIGFLCLCIHSDMYFHQNRLCRGRACRGQGAPSSGIMRAVGGMAGTTRATNDNGIIAKNFVVIENLQHIPECTRYQNHTDDNKSATSCYHS